MTVVTGSEVKPLPMNKILADDDFNCRGKIIPLDVVELAKNIQEQGLIQPVIVRPIANKPGYDYSLVAGFRRYMAHKINHEENIDCIIKVGLTDQEAKMMNLSENLNRKDLNTLQEAKALGSLDLKGLTQQEIADKLNVSRMWVQTRLYVLKLPEPIQREVEAGWINTEHILAIHKLPEKEQLERVKEIKEIKQREGKRTRVPLSKAKIKRDVDAKRTRDKDDIEKMMDHIFDNIGGNFGTRCLAWTLGNISSMELFKDIEEVADNEGKFYNPPTEDL